MSSDVDYDFRDWYSVSDFQFPEFSRGEIEVFIETFKQFDTDKSGAISAKELDAGFKFMGQALEEEDRDLIMATAANKYGEIEWEGFLKIMRLFYPEKRGEFVRDFLVPARNFPEFTRNEILVFVRNFREFDSDNSGAIDEQELEKALQILGQGFDKDELHEFFFELDSDGSGTIEFGEFLALQRLFYPERRREFEREFYRPAKNFPQFSRDDIDVFVSAFRDFDADGSNSIDVTELQSALKAMGQGVTAEEAQHIIDAVDENGTGELEFPGFLQIMSLLYPEKRTKFVKEFYGPARDFPEFTKVEIDGFIQAFKDFDLDGSGAIDSHELTRALQYLGQGSSAEEVKKLQTLVGTDQIQWPQFLQVLRHLYPNKLKEFEDAFYGPAKKFPQFSRDDISAFIEGFRSFDLDGSGAINSKELELVFKAMGQGSSKEVVESLIQTYDANGSGEIEWPEFLQIMADMYGGVKQTPAQPAAKPQPVSQPATKTVAAQPAAKPAAFQPAAKPVQTTPKVQAGVQRGNVCTSCGKTVYPIESLSAADRIWHKGCFKCEAEGCNISLTLKTFTVVKGTVYCSKHVPKEKPTSVAADGNIITANALAAPKLPKQLGTQKNARTTFGAGELPIPEKKN